jgi:hypothetical protein
MCIPEMRPGMKFRIQNALHATQRLSPDRGSGSQPITSAEGSVINAVAKLKGSGTDYRLI